jgi:hypothetical protein
MDGYYSIAVYGFSGGKFSLLVTTTDTVFSTLDNYPVDYYLDKN